MESPLQAPVCALLCCLYGILYNVRLSCGAPLHSNLLSRVYHTRQGKNIPGMATKFAQSELDPAKQKAGYHHHDDTLPLLVYRSE